MSEKRITTENLHVRLAPNTDSAILALMPKGTEIEVEAVTNGWASFGLFNNGIRLATGYASAAYLADPDAPVVHPAVSFTAQPSQITPRQSTTLSWSVEGVDAVKLDGVDEEGVMSRTRTPAETTTYTLSVTYKDGKTEDFKVTVTVITVDMDWVASFYANENLEGEAIATKTYPGPNLSMDVGTGSPAEGVPVDSYSARFSRWHSFEAGTYRFTVTADDGVRLCIDGDVVLDKWQPQVATYSVTCKLSAGLHWVTLEYFEHGGSSKLIFSFTKVNSTRYPRIVGVHSLHDGLDNYLSRLGTKRGRVTCMSADVLRDAIRAGHDGAQRTWNVDTDLSPAQIVALQQYLPDDVKPLVLLILNNEGDWGFGRRAGESIHDWFQRIAKKWIETATLAYQVGYRRFTFGNAPMGCYDWTDEETRTEFGNAFRGLYNNQTLDGTPGGTPCEWWYDGHCYVPDPTWLYESRTVPQVNALSMVTQGQPAMVWGEPAIIRRYTSEKGFQMTWMTPAEGINVYGALPSSGRIIYPWDWFLTRSNFLFWEEMGILFDPNVQRVIGTEGFMDKMGQGGASAQGITPKQAEVYVERTLEILDMPLIVNSKAYENPHRGYMIYTNARNDPQWSGGYGIDYILKSSDADPSKWVMD
jgi:hypothetical protein